MSEWKTLDSLPNNKGAQFLVQRQDGSIGIALILSDNRMLVKAHGETAQNVVGWMALPKPSTTQ